MVRRVSVASLSFSVCFAVLTSLLAAQPPAVVAEPQAPQIVQPQIVQPQVAPKTNPEATQDTVPEIVEVKPQDEQPAAIRKKIRSEYVLPASTKLWVSIPDPKELRARFDSTQLGKLAKDPAIKPFVEGLSDQAQKWLKEQNVRLGLELEDLQGVSSGEICLAGVLPLVAGGAVKGSHGVVLLIDVSQTTNEAKLLQAKINKELIASGAKQEKQLINGIDVTVSTLKKRRLRNSERNFQAIISPAEGTSWMLVSDNELIFRDTLRRLAAPGKIARAGTLVSQPAFVEVMRRTSLETYKSQIRWFIDPFGYIQLAQALQNEKRGARAKRDDWATILKNQGLGAAQAVGGNVGLATGDHEVVHRTFTYAPRDGKVKNAKQMFDLFDFAPNEAALTPPAWVAKDCSVYVSGNWQFSKALDSFGNIYDAFIGEKGSFERLLIDFKVDPDMQLDIKKLVGLIDDRVTIASETINPIDEASERIVIGFPLKGEPDFVYQSLKRATGGREINLGGIKALKVESNSDVVEPDEELDPLGLPDEDEEEDDEEREFTLFEERYIVVAKGYLLVANNKAYLKRILAQKEASLGKSADYREVKAALKKLSDPSKVSWRQFGRTDKALEANYELLRRGEMGKSQTIVGKIINQIFKKQSAEESAKAGKEGDDDVVRKQKLDGSKLPADFKKSIAPYFGPMGWVMETEPDGWRISGALLKKSEK